MIMGFTPEWFVAGLAYVVAGVTYYIAKIEDAKIAVEDEQGLGRLFAVGFLLFFVVATWPFLVLLNLFRRL
jgi:hypothetical protein